MIRILKWTAIVAVVIALSGLIIRYALHEDEPSGRSPERADLLADKMMASVNKEAWDTTQALTWNFMDRNSYLWDKRRGFVKVQWDDIHVLLNTKDQTGMAFRSGKELPEEEAGPLLEEAWSRFCNDSFWLNAVVKAKDPGTKRSIVELDDGREGLKVTYTTGGVTPGDSYVWILDENYRPESFKMWVEIIPIGGLEVTWEEWIQLETGAIVSTSHKTAKMEINVSDVRGASTLQKLTDGKDIFEPLL